MTTFGDKAVKDAITLKLMEKMEGGLTSPTTGEKNRAKVQRKLQEGSHGKARGSLHGNQACTGLDLVLLVTCSGMFALAIFVN